GWPAQSRQSVSCIASLRRTRPLARTSRRLAASRSAEILMPALVSSAEVLRPQSDAELLDLLRGALADSPALGVQGGGSKIGLGRWSEGGVVDVSAVSGIVKYEPEELVLTTRVGTTLIEIAALLAARSQMLAFEPPDYGTLLGSDSSRATLGGLIA